MTDNNSPQLHKNHRERMRKRFIETNGVGFAQHELVEMLLYYAVPRKDTNPLAHEILNAFDGNIADMLCAPFDRLTKIDGVGESVALLLKLVEKISYAQPQSTRKPIPMKDYDEMGRYIVKSFKNSSREKVMFLLLDGKDNCVYSEFFSECGFDFAKVNIRRIMEMTLYKSASKVVIAHNHPDGTLSPSVDDENFTVALASSLNNFNVELKEHYVVADNMYVGIRHLTGCVL